MTENFDNIFKENLIDLKLTQKKKEIELAYTILNLEKRQEAESKKPDAIFTDSILSIKADGEYLSFLKKANSSNIKGFKSSNKNINKFLNNLESLNCLGERELNLEREKTLKDIKKLQGSILELDNLVLATLPSNNYTC